MTEAKYLVTDTQSQPGVRSFLFLRWRFLISNCSQSNVPTTSPALKSSLHPILKIYYFTNPNMSGILLHLHFKPDKIIFRVTFFLEGNFKLNIFFLVISLSLTSPTSLSDCKSLTIKREAMIHCCRRFLPGMWREVQLCISNSGLYLQKIFCKHLKISSLPISHKLICALCQMLTVDASSHTPRQ